MDVETFVAINGRSPLCDVVGFAPERFLATRLFFSVVREQQPEETNLINIPSYGDCRFPSWCSVDGFAMFFLPYQGILPDVMHIMHLSLYPDAYCAVLGDLTDNQDIIVGTSRDNRLNTLWQSYREWAEQEGLGMTWVLSLFCVDRMAAVQNYNYGLWSWFPLSKYAVTNLFRHLVRQHAN